MPDVLAIAIAAMAIGASATAGPSSVRLVHVTSPVHCGGHASLDDRALDERDAEDVARGFAEAG